MKSVQLTPWKRFFYFSLKRFRVLFQDSVQSVLKSWLDPFLTIYGIIKFVQILQNWPLVVEEPEYLGDGDGRHRVVLDGRLRLGWPLGRRRRCPQRRGWPSIWQLFWPLSGWQLVRQLSSRYLVWPLSSWLVVSSWDNLHYIYIYIIIGMSNAIGTFRHCVRYQALLGAIN